MSAEPSISEIATQERLETVSEPTPERSLSPDEQIATANAAEKIWGKEQSFIDTAEIETRHTQLLLEALRNGDITPEQLATTIGRRMAEMVVAGEKDERTGLDNHSGGLRKTQKELARAVRDQTTTSALMIDLDGFKQTNDNLGHLAGDQALLAAGQHIAANVREYDIAYRWGGDEFFVTLPDASVQDAVARVGMRLLTGARDSIREQMEGMGYEMPTDITFSIGAAQDIPPKDTKDSSSEERANRLTDLADKAVLVSKFRGKNRITIGQIIEGVEVFVDPSTGEMFTGEFEIKSNGDQGKKLLRLNPYTSNG